MKKKKKIHLLVMMQIIEKKDILSIEQRQIRGSDSGITGIVTAALDNSTYANEIRKRAGAF